MSALDGIRQRAEAATEGPWTPQDYDHNPGDQGVPIIGGGEIGSMAGHLTAYTMTLSNEAQSVADAEFIVAARNQLPRILDALDAVMTLADKWAALGPEGDWAEGGMADTVLSDAGRGVIAAIAKALEEKP
jgi:hypothetical protein